ncbi:hypothetical protein SKAU_G00415240 [Synaphobranchus kaupii]|uniref:Uncharacterized protein n=1 Tax=Synaphobranchus kaupii TaxID=118154 RepID=A0A9Q1E7A5_SYNKA|nr:hypothetical protein SKAU_G00415240 [Synaphobranchus kaupii]
MAQKVNEREQDVGRSTFMKDKNRSLLHMLPDLLLFPSLTFLQMISRKQPDQPNPLQPESPCACPIVLSDPRKRNSLCLISVQIKFGLPSDAVLRIYDDTETEVEEDVLEELLKEKPDLMLTIRDQNEDAGPSSSCTDTLSLSSHSSSDLDRTPERPAKISKPADESAKEEHFYDSEGGTGYIAWRLKTVQRNHRARTSSHTSHSTRTATGSGLSGPSLNRCTSPAQQLDEDSLREAIAFLTHSSDEAQIFLKMKETFHYRHALVHDPNKTDDILKTFPRFLNTKGLVSQDFSLLFNAEMASKLLERWDTAFKKRIIEEAMGLTSTPAVRSLLLSARNETDSEDCSKWDSDMATLLLLIHLLPPPPGGKRAAKISAVDAASRLVVYHKSCNSIDEHLRQREGRQPYILAVGGSPGQIDHFYLALDKKLIPCQAGGSLSAFDALFKSHFVFNVMYDIALINFYTFIQTTVYRIDVGKTKESPRVKELRTKLLN